MGNLRFALIVAALLGLAAPAQAQDDALAAAAASELREMCAGDGGRLWGLSLCGPLLIVDPATRGVWASTPDPGGRLLQQRAGGWVGTLDAGVAVANTAVEWSGVRWIMIAGPLPQDPTERRVLVAHEAWHRIQPLIRLAPQSSDCPHLETERGRYLLRLEMRALSAALRSREDARRRAAAEALAFRALRLQAFQQAAAQEAALDRNEGLASYTGVRLGAGPTADAFAAHVLDTYDAHQSFARAYAYATGPGYGLLLDDLRPTWRGEIAGWAPPDLLAWVLSVEAPRGRRMVTMAERYGGPGVLAEERVRGEAQRVRVAALRAQFTSGPRLVLPLAEARLDFDPQQVTPIEGVGNLYTVLTLRDQWGELSAREGALISSDFRRLTASTPAPGGLSGPGWRLNLAQGWLIAGPGADGAFEVVRAPAPPARR